MRVSALGFTVVFSWLAHTAALATTPSGTGSQASGSGRAAETPGDFGGQVAKFVKRVLNEDWKDSSCGVRVIDVPTGRVLHEEYVNGRKRIFAASSIKTLLAIAVLRRLERIRALSPAERVTPLEKELGKATLDEQLDTRVRITQRHTNVECKRFRERRWRCHNVRGRLRGPYVRGVRRKLRELFDDMLWISSNNVAGSQLVDIAVDRGGRNELGFIKETAALLTHPDPPAMQLAKKFWTYAWPGGGLGRGDNVATARDFITMYQEIATGQRRVLAEDSRAFLYEQLRRQTTESKLNFHWKNEATFLHKSGHSVPALSDAGFFYLGKRKLVLVAVLFNVTEERFRAKAPPKRLMQRLGNHLFRMVEKKYGEVARFVFPAGW